MGNKESGYFSVLLGDAFPPNMAETERIENGGQKGVARRLRLWFPRIDNGHTRRFKGRRVA